MTVKSQKLFAILMLLFPMVSQLHAQTAGGTLGIDAATSALNGYVDPVSTLTLAIGAIVGVVGGIRVYVKWNSGDHDIHKELMGWMASCLFLVLVSVVIKGFFGV